MFRHAFLLAAWAAAAANALLLPPGFHQPGDKNGLLYNAESKSRTLLLPCPSCTFPPLPAALETADEVDVLDWFPGASKDIMLNFRVSHDGRQLLLNDEPIYPRVFHGVQSSTSPVYVEPASIPSGVAKPLEITASSLRIDLERPISDDGDVVVPIRYRILALDTRQVKEMPTISVHVLKTIDGELFILEATIPSTKIARPTPPPPPPPPPHHEHHECRVWPAFTCKLNDFVHEKWNSIWSAEKPECNEHEMHPHPFSFDDDHKTGSIPTPPPHPPLPHHEFSHGKNDHRSIFHTIFRGVVGALIPILAGITVGLSVSFMALTLGRAIAWSFARMRGAPPASHRHCGHRYVLNASDLAEGKILTEDDEVDIPPAYENAPAYDDIV